jgi:hypothetical protein
LAGCLKNPLRPKPPRPPAHARDRHFQSAALLPTSVPSVVIGLTLSVAGPRLPRASHSSQAPTQRVIIPVQRY